MMDKEQAIILRLETSLAVAGRMIVLLIGGTQILPVGFLN